MAPARLPAASPKATPDILDRLAATIAARRGGDPSTSYVASLFAKGEDAILKKIGAVLLACHGLGPADVRAELARREGVSGVAEKSTRRL